LLNKKYPIFISSPFAFVVVLDLIFLTRYLQKVEMVRGLMMRLDVDVRADNNLIR